MRLVTFERRGDTHIGAVLSRDGRDWIFDFNCANSRLPTDMVEFLRLEDTARALSGGEQNLCLESDVTLLAPVPRPGKLICVGHNYHGHTGAAPPAYPDIFAKFANVVIGPHQPVVLPGGDIQLDYEGELAVVIGKRTRYISQDRALECVAGYTIFNDMTARAIVKHSSQWTLGKSFDTFGPMGPVLVTADEIPDPGNLELSLTVNGEERQHSNTCNLIFSVPFLISYLSQSMTLEPGDVISTGTPGGIGALRNPPVFLKPGDEMVVRIEKLGELANPIVSEA